MGKTLSWSRAETATADLDRPHGTEGEIDGWRWPPRRLSF
jgi:hypothetical protein